MKQVILNIGLNVGTIEPMNQLTKTLDECTCIGHYTDVKINVGTYQGMTERTLVLTIDYVGNYESVKNVLALISENLNQECIAIYNTQLNEGDVIYPLTHQGDKMKFNSKYFIK